LTVFDRAAVVSAIISLGFFALLIVLLMRTPADMLVPLLLGVGLKGALAAGFAAVMALAGRVERRRTRCAILATMPVREKAPERRVA